MRLVETNVAVVLDRSLSVPEKDVDPALTVDVGYYVGRVVCVGPGREDELMVVNVGETVVFPSYCGHQIKDKDGNPIVILRQFDILAVLD